MTAAIVCALALAGLPEAPVLKRVEVSREDLPLAGSTIEFKDGPMTFYLYLPTDWEPKREETLTVHFHTARRVSIPQHLAAGLDGPLLVFNNGAGSRVYQQPFLDPGRFQRWMERCRRVLIPLGAPEDVRWEAIDISSFSAGYGAVRELVQVPELFARMRRVVLADSLYGDVLEGRRPHPRDIDVWLPLAEAAKRGEKTFLITVSEVPTSYASSSECAAAIVAGVGGSLEPAPPDATSDPNMAEWRLRRRFDAGRLHVWLYEGADGPAHMAHARNLGALWKSLDDAGAP
ncbi:MAG: hypothetical protein SNJ76_09925 [Fimbriimonadaceae bacterium]